MKVNNTGKKENVVEPRCSFWENVELIDAGNQAKLRLRKNHTSRKKIHLSDISCDNEDMTRTQIHILVVH